MGKKQEDSLQTGILESPGEAAWQCGEPENESGPTDLKLDEEEMPPPARGKVPWHPLHSKSTDTDVRTPFNGGSGEGQETRKVLSLHRTDVRAPAIEMIAVSEGRWRA